MPENLDSALILRDLHNQIAEMHDTVCKTHIVIADSEEVIRKANDLLKSGTIPQQSSLARLVQIA